MAGIVVGMDGSARAGRALSWAMEEAALRQTPLTVLTVHETIVSHATGNPVIYADAPAGAEKQRQLVEGAVEKVSGRLGYAKPPSVTVRAVIGLPAQELIDASRDADLVVVGSRGGGGFASLLLGSVSSKVVHHAICPVTVVPYER
jgi:nucleotide-binding universal stress UspA family protein